MVMSMTIWIIMVIWMIGTMTTRPLVVVIVMMIFATSADLISAALSPGKLELTCVSHCSHP